MRRREGWCLWFTQETRREERKRKEEKRDEKRRGEEKKGTPIVKFLM
jgi:hypothetical protein